MMDASKTSNKFTIFSNAKLGWPFQWEFCFLSKICQKYFLIIFRSLKLDHRFMNEFEEFLKDCMHIVSDLFIVNDQFFIE